MGGPHVPTRRRQDCPSWPRRGPLEPCTWSTPDSLPCKSSFAYSMLFHTPEMFQLLFASWKPPHISHLRVLSSFSLTWKIVIKSCPSCCITSPFNSCTKDKSCYFISCFFCKRIFNSVAQICYWEEVRDSQADCQLLTDRASQEES